MIINRKYYLILFFLLQLSVFAQIDWVRWEKSNPTYQIKNSYIERDYDLSINSISDLIIKPIFNSYWFFVSDVDGANCPFQPSCSSFLLQSVKKTNFAQGILMFFDRFTRDTNFINRQQHYPYYDNVHFYDPVENYALDSKKIKYIPPNVKAE